MDQLTAFEFFQGNSPRYNIETHHPATSTRNELNAFEFILFKSQDSVNMDTEPSPYIKEIKIKQAANYLPYTWSREWVSQGGVV
jgi:hypothetical protein